jgi:predicted component of type VI protein secretion system
VGEQALTLEIVEGPCAGRQVLLDRPIVIGRALDSDLVLEDAEVSRHHARVTPKGAGLAVVDDLGSANGTFVGRNQLNGPAQLKPGDELLVGVTLMLVRSGQQVAAQPSAVRPVPLALASAPRTPDYVDPELIRAELGPSAPDGRAPPGTARAASRVRAGGVGVDRLFRAPLAMSVWHGAAPDQRAAK